MGRLYVEIGDAEAPRKITVLLIELQRCFRQQNQYKSA